MLQKAVHQSIKVQKPITTEISSTSISLESGQRDEFQFLWISEGCLILAQIFWSQNTVISKTDISSMKRST